MKPERWQDLVEFLPPPWVGARVGFGTLISTVGDLTGGVGAYLGNGRSTKTIESREIVHCVAAFGQMTMTSSVCISLDDGPTSREAARRLALAFGCPEELTDASVYFGIDGSECATTARWTLAAGYGYQWLSVDEMGAAVEYATGVTDRRLALAMACRDFVQGGGAWAPGGGRDA